VEAQEILQEKLQINLGLFFLRGINLYIFSRFIKKAIHITALSAECMKRRGSVEKRKKRRTYTINMKNVMCLLDLLRSILMHA
jgi:hypothetical protein